MANRIEDSSIDEWDASLSTGVPSLDEQHKLLFQHVNLLLQAAAEHSMLRTFYVMEQLGHYVQTHFAEEESLMRAHGFPRLADHIREHQAFTARLHELHKAYLNRDISVDLVMMLREWLKNHVAGTDMEYVPYLAVAPRARVAAACAIPADELHAGRQALPCFS